MNTRFVEVTDGVAYGKFLVCRMTAQELTTRSHMPGALPTDFLLTYGGRRRFNNHSTFIIDLQLGTGAAWPLLNLASDYQREHLQGLPMCPLYMPFVEWLSTKGDWAMGSGDINDIPRYLDLRS